MFLQCLAPILLDTVLLISTQLHCHKTSISVLCIKKRVNVIISAIRHSLSHCITTLFSKRNATLVYPFSLVSSGHWHRVLIFYTTVAVHWIQVIHSSPKEMQLKKGCVSFGKECTNISSGLIPYIWKSNKEDFFYLVIILVLSFRRRFNEMLDCSIRSSKDILFD